MPKISKEQKVVNYIRENCMVEGGDNEIQHSNADKALRDFLLSLGYKKIVEAWDEVTKWYA